MTDLDWDSYGDGERTLIWAHGLTSSRKAQADSPLAGITLGAAAGGWRVIRYDARGHGESPKPHDPDCYRWDRLADDMLEVADAVGVERFVAAGASMGAATSLFAALKAPERVEATVVVIAPTAWETRAAQGDAYETSASIVEAKGLDRLIAAASMQPPSTMFGEVGKERSLANMAAMDPEAFPHVMRGAAQSDLPTPDEIASIEAPTLLLSWAGDDGHPVSTGERLAELLPSSELRVALSPTEVEDWPQIIAEFLDRLS